MRSRVSHELGTGLHVYSLTGQGDAASLAALASSIILAIGVQRALNRQRTRSAQNNLTFVVRAQAVCPDQPLLVHHTGIHVNGFGLHGAAAVHAALRLSDFKAEVGQARVDQVHRVCAQQGNAATRCLKRTAVADTAACQHNLAAK